MKTTEFLDAVRARHQLTSDYRLAKFLGVPQTTISGYRVGRSMMDEAMCLKVAAALELEPGEVLVAIAIEREKRVEVKTAWQRVAKRLAAGAGAALLYITTSAAPNPSAAVAGPIYTYATFARCREGVAAWRKRALQALSACLQGLTHPRELLGAPW